MNIRKIIQVGASGPLLTVIDQGLVSIGNFLAIVIPAKILDSRGFGVYVIAITTIFMITGITKGLVTNPLRVLGVDVKRSKLDAYISDQIFYLVFLSAPLALGISLILPMIFDATRYEALAAGIAFFCFQFHDLSRAARSVNSDWKMLLISDSMLHAARLGGLTVLWLNNILDCYTALLLYAVSSLMSVSLTRFLRRIQVFNLDRFKQTAKQTWAYGRWLLGETIVFTISTQAYVLLVGILLGTALAGVYGAMQQLVNVINVLHIGIVGYLTPNVRRKLNSNNYTGWRAQLRIALSALFTITVIIVVPLCIYGEIIVDIVYSSAWVSYAPVLYMLGIAAIFASINAVLSVAFRTANLPQVGLFAKTAAGVVTIFVAIPLINQWGIYGAAAGLVITQICWLSVYLYEIYIRSRLSEANIIP